MSIYAYVRVSTEMQTLENQKFEIERYCKVAGIEIDKWVKESVSGTVNINKRKLGKALKAMKKGDLLICSELSRLGRNMLMVMSILNICADRGIAIHTIKDNFDLSDNLNSKIIAFAFALASEIERNLISQRTKEALALRKKAGVKLGRPCGPSKLEISIRKQENIISEMINDGQKLTVVAKKCGIHRNTLMRYIKKWKNSEFIPQ